MSPAAPEGQALVIIVNAIKPYGYELNNILASPNGQHYRCRYRNEWVSLDEPPQSLIGRTGIIVARAFHEGRLIPVREISVDSIRQIGDILYIEYQLRQMIPLSNDRAERGRQIMEFQESLLAAAPGDPNVPGEDFRSLIFLVPNFDELFSAWRMTDAASDDSESRWGSTIEELQNVPMFDDVDFLRVVGFRDDSNQPAVVDKNGRYQLISGRRYSLEVLQRTNSGAIGDSGVGSTRNLLLDVDKGVLQPLRDTLPITGRYDLFVFTFRAASATLPAASSILLRVTPTERLASSGANGDPGANGRIGPIPDVVLSVVVERTPRQWVSLVTRLALATILLVIYFVPGVVVDPFVTVHDTLLLPGHTETIQTQWESGLSQVALILFILLSSGSLAGAFRAFSTRGGSP